MHDLSLHAIRDALARREFSSAEITAHFLARIARLNRSRFWFL